MAEAHEPKADAAHSGEWSGEEPEHQCGGPKEACGEPGCLECGTPEHHEVESRRECPYYADTCRQIETELRRERDHWKRQASRAAMTCLPLLDRVNGMAPRRLLDYYAVEEATKVLREILQALDGEVTP